MRLSAATALKVALGGFIALAIFIFLYQRYEQSVAGVEIDAATHDLDGAAGSLRSLLAEAEASARGYALTGQAAYLEASAEAVTGVASQMDRLRRIVGPRDDQRRRLAELDGAVRAKVTRVRRLIDLRRSGQLDAARMQVAGEARLQPVDRIALLVQAMADDARAVTAARSADLRAAVRTTRWLMVGLFGMSIALLLFAVLRVRRELRRRIEAENALRTAYAQVEERVRQRTSDLLRANTLLRDSEDRYRQLADQKEEALLERSEALTREQAARADAELANRFRDRFLATVSHELRTPLNAIVGWTHLLRAGMMDNTARALEAIDRNAALQARLIDDLLDVSRLEQGRFSLAPVTVDLRTVVSAAVSVAEQAARAKSVTIECSMTEEPVTLLGDQRRLQQAVANLLANAVKFSRSGGTVTVTVGIVGGAARLEVQDAGEGIDASFLPHAFQAFRQDTTRPARAGLGLGLAIARGIIDRHQGTIVVQSAGRDRGTVFSVTLPLGSQEDLTAPAERMPADPDMTSPAHVARGALPEVDRGAEAEPATPQPADGHRRKRARLLQQH